MNSGATASTMDFAAGPNRSLLVSVLIHAVLIVLLSLNVNLFSDKPVAQLAIQAVLVDPNSLAQRPKATPPPVEPVEVSVPEPEPEPEPVAEPEPEPIPEPVEPEVDQQEVLRQQQQEREAEALREKERQVQLQKDREAADKRKAEQAAQEQKDREAAAERERKKQADAAAEKKRQAEAAERKEKERRQAELMAAMEAEEALAAAAQSGEMSQYQALLQQKVERYWARPPSFQSGMECVVDVSQLPSGDVIDVRIVSCDGDIAVQRSVENAIRRASPLPLPDNRALFDRNLRFTYKPQ